MNDDVANGAPPKSPQSSPVSRKTFRDASRQRRFEEVGFVALPLLAPHEVSSLMAHYLALTGGRVTNTNDGIYVSSHADVDPAVKRETLAELRRVIAPRLSEHLFDYRFNGGTYLVKNPHPWSQTYPHQDWNYLDHDRYRDDCSITAWITLKDVDASGGSLGFIPGSHRFFDLVLGSPFPAARTPTQGHGELLLQYMIFPQLKAGEAVIFHNKCVHGAMSNTSQQQRVAVTNVLTPAEASLHHYYLKPGTLNTLLKLEVEVEFFAEYSSHRLYQLYQSGEIPGRFCWVRGELTQEFAPLSAGRMEALCLEHGVTKHGLTANFKPGANGGEVGSFGKEP